MSTQKNRNTSDLGLGSHSAGKGSRPRNVGPAFRLNYDEISWHPDPLAPTKARLTVKAGGRAVYTYHG